MDSPLLGFFVKAFYRCRRHQGNKTAVKQCDCSFLFSVPNCDGRLGHFCHKLNVYGKEQHPQGNSIRNGELGMRNYRSDTFSCPSPNSSLLIPNWLRHPDHLGSSSWITYSDGSAVQHLHYLPWGEDFVNQRTSSFSSMYTFSAKEKDAETGYSYFGARYYSSDLSIWISVDPQAHKYPSLSPYTYCADNPVKLVDPNGEKIDPESMQAWNTLKSDMIGRKDFLKPFAILNKTTHGVLCKKEAERYNSLCNTLNSMEDLEYSDQLYRLGTIEGSVGNVTLNDDESLTINYCNTANFIHEMTHCVQFERGDIGFFKGGGAQAFTDVYDEIESYTAQAAYDPTTIPNYSKRYTPLTPQWIKHMKYGDGGYIYPNCGLIRYDGNATASDMNRIFTNFLVPLDFEGKLREQPGTYFK